MPASQPATRPATTAVASHPATATHPDKPAQPLTARLRRMLTPRWHAPRPEIWQECLVQAVTALRSDPRAQMAAGDRALAVGNTDRAVACFRQAASLAPNNLDALEGLAIAMTVAKQSEQALTVCRRIIQLQPNNSVARFNYAVTLMQLDRLSEAQKEYEDLLARDPSHFRARYNLAALFQSQGKLSQAAACWLEAMKFADKMAPADASAGWSHYGQVLFELGETAQSADAYAEAAKLSPDSPAAWLNYAAAARLAGQLGHAVVAARRAMKVAPREPVVWLRLGELMLDLYQQTRRSEYLTEAVQAWKISLQLNPNQPGIKKRLEIYDSSGK